MRTVIGEGSPNKAGKSSSHGKLLKLIMLLLIDRLPDDEKLSRVNVVNNKS